VARAACQGAPEDRGGQGQPPGPEIGRVVAHAGEDCRARSSPQRFRQFTGCDSEPDALRQFQDLLPSLFRAERRRPAQPPPDDRRGASRSGFFAASEFMDGVACDGPADSERDRLVEWVVRVHRSLKLASRTLFLAVHLLDRLRQIQSSRPPLLDAAVSLLLASKFEEEQPASMAALVSAGRGSFRQSGLEGAEVRVLAELDFSLHGSTVAHFLPGFLGASLVAACPEGRQQCAASDAPGTCDCHACLLTQLSEYLSELSLLVCRTQPVASGGFPQYRPPSLQAAAAVLLASELLGAPIAGLPELDGDEPRRRFGVLREIVADLVRALRSPAVGRAVHSKHLFKDTASTEAAKLGQGHPPSHSVPTSIKLALDRAFISPNAFAHLG